MDGGDLFQHDMTQPHGLGTKVARTFVTRCLVGDPGITYKYLGIRMFSHPWTEGQPGASAATVTVGRLNDRLVARSQQLLKTMAREQVGATTYNLTLINRCFPLGEVRLKDEPYYGGSCGGEKVCHACRCMPIMPIGYPPNTHQHTSDTRIAPLIAVHCELARRLFSGPFQQHRRIPLLQGRQPRPQRGQAVAGGSARGA